jgi:hypothetical protein
MFNITPVTIHRKNLGGWHLDELGKRAIEIRAHPDSLRGAKSPPAHAGTYQYAQTDGALVPVGSNSNDAAATIRALDKRKRRRLAPAAVFFCCRLFLFGNRRSHRARCDGLGVPPKARVDFGVVDAGREDLQQHFA